MILSCLTAAVNVSILLFVLVVMLDISDTAAGELPGDADAAIRQLYARYAQGLRNYVEPFCPDRASADDQRVCFDGGLRRAQRTSSEILSVLSFHSSASGRAGLRLVMLFQPSARASSALSLMKAIWLLGRSSSA